MTTDENRVSASKPSSPTTPVGSDEMLEPVDMLGTNNQRVLFYLAGRVPVSIQELAADTTQSAATLRGYFHQELQNKTDLDSTDFVRLTHSAREPVIRASRAYVESGQAQFDAGQSSIDQELFEDAVDYFERAIELFEQVQVRLAAVNYRVEKLETRIEITQNSIIEAEESIRDSAGQVDTLLSTDQSDARSNASASSSTTSAGTDDREAMLTVVSDLHTRLGRVPKTTELPEESAYTPNDFYQEFGSWDETLEAAGIDKEQALLDDIERVAEKLGYVPNSADMDRHGTYAGSNYSTYFGSWSTALEQSDVEQLSETELVDTLRSLRDRLDRVPKTTDLDDFDEISQQQYTRTFGSWDKALDAADIDKQQHLIEDLKEVAAAVGGKPETTDANQFGTYSASTYHKQFGSWDAALEAAGLTSLSSGTETQQEMGQQSSDVETVAPSTPIEEITDYIDSLALRDVSALVSAGYTTAGDLRKVEPKEVAKHRGVGRTKAIELVRFATENVSEPQDSLTSASHNGDQQSSSRKSTEATSQSAGDSTKVPPETPLDEIETHLNGVGQSSIHAVKKAGYTTLGDLHGVQPAAITKHRGIGRTKALKLIEFAEERLSGIGTSLEQTTDHQTAPDRSISAASGAGSSQVNPRALDSSWETIPENERIDRQFLLQVTDVNQTAGSRKTAQLSVQDKNGRTFELDVWSKHEIDQEWREGNWYALEDARGKAWESSGETTKRLSSTKDLNVLDLGEDFDPSAVSAGDASNTPSVSQAAGTPANETGGKSASNATAAGQGTTSTTGETQSAADTESAVDDDTSDKISALMDDMDFDSDSS